MPVGEVFLSDNSGNRVPPTPQLADPVPGSGIRISMPAPGTDYQQPLVGGKSYIITFTSTTATDHMLASSTGVTSTVTNIEWVFMANTEYVFRMPMDEAVLFCESNAGATGYAHIRELAG